MESDLWRGFVSVAETGSFTAASDRLPISQSGLSQQIRRLESQLGVELFERTSRTVTMTADAERLLPMVQALLDKEDEILRTARERSQEAVPTDIRIFVAESATGAMLVDLVDRVRASMSHVRVHVVQVRIAEQADCLASGDDECQALVERTPHPQPEGRGRRTALRREEMCVVVPDDAEVAERLTVGEAAALDLRPLDFLPDEWLEWCPVLRGSSNPVAEAIMDVDSFRSAIQSVPLDRRPCVVPFSIAESMRQPGCRVVRLDDAPVASLDLVTNGQHELLDLLHNIAAELTTVPSANDRSETPAT